MLGVGDRRQEASDFLTGQEFRNALGTLGEDLRHIEVLPVQHLRIQKPDTMEVKTATIAWRVIL